MSEIYKLKQRMLERSNLAAKKVEEHRLAVRAFKVLIVDALKSTKLDTAETKFIYYLTDAIKTNNEITLDDLTEKQQAGLLQIEKKLYAVG